jgi:hypothetical protein
LAAAVAVRTTHHTQALLTDFLVDLAVVAAGLQLMVDLVLPGKVTQAARQSTQQQAHTVQLAAAAQALLVVQELPALEAMGELEYLLQLTEQHITGAAAEVVVLKEQELLLVTAETAAVAAVLFIMAVRQDREALDTTQVLQEQQALLEVMEEQTQAAAAAEWVYHFTLLEPVVLVL